MTANQILQRFNRLLFYAILIFIVTLFFFPFMWVAFTAFQDAINAGAVPPDLLAPPTLDNFRQVFEEGGFAKVKTPLHADPVFVKQ